jgi:hypothetical protein
MKIPTLALLTLLAFAAGCSKSPTRPSATVSTPSAVSPANGATIGYQAQPATLTISNASSSDSTASVVYTFEVATDAAFANKVVTRDVPQGTGQTSLVLDTLTGGQTYFWHVRATAGSAVGTFGSAMTFTIGPAIVLQAPAVVLPVSGTRVDDAKPALTISNASHTGPVGAITYRFEIASDSSFATIAASGTVDEGATQTTFTPTSNLAYKTTFYWHARAIDATNSATGPYSTTATFVTGADPSALWPNDEPPGTTGHAIRGDNWEEQELISFGGVHFHSPTLEMNRLFDLFDRGMSPQEAIDWMHEHGYPTVAAYYPGPEVIGIQYMYLAFINGRWDVVVRSEGE